MNWTRKRRDEDLGLSPALRDWDPAHGKQLDRDEAGMLRARILEESRRKTPSLPPRLMLAAAALVLAVLAGTLLVSTPLEGPAPVGASGAQTRLQVQLTGESGTRIFWTIEGQGDE